ncbi:MAG: 50S ribosome-binding GTPase [Lachnospiraceae bacterium]|nr:50S ribosome-binding GTPase [Lachnospiraceae bacterium]
MTTYDVQELARKILDQIKSERDGMANLNVMVLGKTGVGKSTLINNLFNENFADTGIGKPVTDQIKAFTKEGVPLTIYDTPGLELGGGKSYDSLLDQVSKVIKDKAKSGDVEQAIHCILYCVNANSHRFEDKEIEFIKKFSEENQRYEIPVIVVVTQTHSKKEAEALIASIKQENLNVCQIVPVLASSFELDDEYTIQAFGLEHLTEVIYEVIPEAIKKTFVSVQKANIKMKAQKSQLVVLAAASAAAATGAVPIPVADAFVLVPEQIAMLASITNIYGLSIEKSAISAVVSATLGTASATIAGKTVVSSLLKLIPGYGSAVGGAISGGVAAAITAALGEAYIAVMTAVATGEMKETDITSSKGKKYITELFKSRLKLKRDNKGVIMDDEADDTDSKPKRLRIGKKK